MSITKIIKFYYVEPEPCITINGMNNEHINKFTYDIFHSAIPNIDYYKLEFEKKELFFDIIEYDKTKIFGTCSVKEIIKPTNFMLERNKETKETKPFTTIGNESELESYTFFYVDFLRNRMAVIANRKITKIHEALCQLIWERSNNCSKITILPEMIEDMTARGQALSELSWLEYELGRSYSKNYIPPLNDALDSDFTPTKVKIALRLENAKPKTIIPKLLSWKKQNTQGELEKLRLIGKNEFGLNETLDFIENIYTKTVPLEISDDTVTNINYIKNCLAEFLIQHLRELT